MISPQFLHRKNIKVGEITFLLTIDPNFQQGHPSKALRKKNTYGFLSPDHKGPRLFLEG